MTKQSDIEMVAKARAWAIKAHAGQTDKAGKDYFRAHVAAVAEGVKGDPLLKLWHFCMILSSANSVNAINPYALYDYLLTRNWSVDRKSTRTPVLETPDGSAEITVPIDLALDDYESRMANALGVLCSYEDVLLSNVIVRIAAWKPAMY